MELEWTFPISPVAASRPRVSRYGAYFTGPYKKFREEGSQVIYEVLGADFDLIDQPLMVDLECYIKQPKSTKLGCPKGDIDNFIKGIFDLLNGKLWTDDGIIRSVHATKEWAPKGEDGYFTLGIRNV